MIGLGLSITQLAVRQLVGQFNPMKLFALGEQGAWYDPSDLSTLYQDAAGTTPVTAVEQPVGLMLDKSKGLVLGPEVVVNGTFDSDTAWTKGAGWNISEGSANFFGSTLSNLTQVIPNLDQKPVIAITFTISNYVSGSCKIILVGGSSVTGLSYSGNGTYTGYLKTNIGNTTIVFQAATAAPTELSIDNISVREIPGAHAFQTTATSRPVLSARVNLLTKTEQFDDAVWTKTLTTFSGNTLTASAGAGGHKISHPASIASPFTVFADVKAGTHSFVQITGGGDANRYANFDIANGVIGNVGSAATASILPLGNGVFRISAAFATGTGFLSIAPSLTAGFAASFTAIGTESIEIYRQQLVPANQADLPYQRVNTATDYDAGPAFPHYLRCDGIDDGMVTGTITPGTDKAQVFAGVRKLGTSLAVVCELSPATSNGSFGVFAPRDRGAFPQDYGVISRGTASIDIDTNSAFESAPHTAVLTAVSDIGAPLASLRVNGALGASSTATQGTGNFLAYPLYLFRRGGTSLPFNGHFYGGIIRFGPNLPIETIQQTEAYMNSKTQAIDWRDITDSSSFRWNSATASPDAE